MWVLPFSCCYFFLSQSFLILYLGLITLFFFQFPIVFLLTLSTYGLYHLVMCWTPSSISFLLCLPYAFCVSFIAFASSLSFQHSIDLFCIGIMRAFTHHLHNPGFVILFVDSWLGYFFFTHPHSFTGGYMVGEGTYPGIEVLSFTHLKTGRSGHVLHLLS